MTWPQYLRKECTACGFQVKLSPSETEILLLLLLRGKRPTTMEDMIRWVYPNPDFEPEDASNSIAHALDGIRKKIGGFHLAYRAAFGYTIKHNPD